MSALTELIRVRSHPDWFCSFADAVCSKLNTAQTRAVRARPGRAAHSVVPDPFQMSLICINVAEETGYFLQAGDPRNLTRENIMSTFYKKAALICAAAAAGAVLCAMPISVERSAISGIVLSIDEAQARVGHPATPGSVAGVHRRTTRRAVRHCAAGVTCY